ncbi:MAG: MHS family MFS transporter [Acidipropionibacterium jensenii]|nr:MHS family MFS transporter [Acidipropionibacterium acidipropionici]MDN6618111.1 MHS family MFS transporter [Corynebacterium variabile]MDN6657859.1 MHS family MFS transporter [Acidipropionibacterium jensenii]MDN6813130.1 MHS family MFS transporter [Corynebacterium variabile]
MRKVVTASSVGTLVEWYDFYIYGSLAVVFSGYFFPEGNPFVALLVTVAAFGTGFVVRPLGALFFGRMGDKLGRKRTFLATLVLMGTATTLTGLLPTYDAVGVLAPVALVVLRLLQGLAIGGEYGGAAVYIAEYAPPRRSGFLTSFLQTTATLGLLTSILVIVLCRLALGEETFAAWGWRVPFLLSAVLVIFSLVVRLKIHESPVFERMRRTGTLSKSPIKDSLGNRHILALVVVVLFGVTAGLGVAWYTAQFYSLYFLQTNLGVEFLAANITVGIALALGTPFFVLFGALSDRYGRLRFAVAGLVLSAVSYVPLFSWIREAAPTGRFVEVTAAIFIQIVFVTMIYGPTAAYLVDLFPPQIRYTGISVVYHLGTGVFGGFTPLIALAATGGDDSLSGLLYPIIVTAVSAIVAATFLRSGSRSPVVRRAWDATQRLQDATAPTVQQTE